MSEMNTNYTFTNDKFIINSNVYFTVDTTVVNGHRICKLKSLKIYYHRELFAMKVSSTIYKYFIQYGLQSIFSVELINYLNRIINHENLYDIYSDKNIPNLSVLRSQHRDLQEELSSFIIHDKSNDYDLKRYKEGIISDSHFVKSELNKLRNSNFPICYSKFEDIKNIPIYCYVHPALAINQGSTIILCHIGYILEKLANYHRFPEFNTQAIISFMNVVNESTRNNLTAERLNNLNLEIEFEKLQKKYLKKKNKCKSMSEEIRDLSKKIDNQTEEIKSLNQSNLGLKQEVNSLNQTIEENNSKIDNLNQTLGKVVTNVKYLASSSIEFQQEVRYRDEKLIKHINTKLPERIITTGSTNEVFILLYSKSLNARIHQVREDLSDDEIIIDSISCQNEIVDQELKYHNYDKTQDKFVYYKSLQSNSLDINRYIKENNHIFKPIKGYIRKFIINKSNIPKIKEDLDAIVDKSVLPRTDILTTINNNSDSCESIIEKFSQPLNNISEAISDVEIANSNDKEEIKEMIQIMNERIQKIEDNQEKIIHNQELLINLLTSLDPRVKQFQIKLDHFYYDVNIDLDNKQVLYATKRSKDGKFSDFQPLTIDLFNKSTFRDKNFTKDIYPPSKRRINE